MPERNRVTPHGEIVAIPLRGAWTGNRGVLHQGHEIVRSHASDLWITCALEFRGRWRQQWLPRRYTHLYFHDEAVSFAAGHRPCAECRRADYRAYQQAWAVSLITARSAAGADTPGAGRLPTAKEMNAQLHRERIVPGTHRRRLHDLPWAGLPDGTFVLLGRDGSEDGDAGEGEPVIVVGATVVPWTTEGYGKPRPRPARGTATVITPPSTVAVLRAGYPVQVDDSALSGR
jgi:hypothetical protein